MDHQNQQYFHQINELVLAHLAPVFVNKLESQIKLINQAKSSLAEYYADIDPEDNKVELLEMVRKMKMLKESLASSVNSITMIGQDINLVEDFKEYFNQLKIYTDTLPESLHEYQNLNRFQPFPNDSFRIKVGKRFKRLSLILGWIPQRAANWVRRRTNKQAIDLKPWKHQIPLKGLLTYHFRDLLVGDLIDIMQTVNRAIATSTNDLFQTEASLDHKFANFISEEYQDGLKVNSTDHDNNIDQVLSKINELVDSIPGLISSRLEKKYSIFQANYEMVGTIELPSKKFKALGLKIAHQHAIKTYGKAMLGWRNTLAVLIDQYNFDHELFNIKFTNLEQYLFISQKLESRISQKILKEINLTSEFLSTKKTQLEGSSIKDADFKKSLKEIRFEIIRYLKVSIPTCIQVIREQNIPGMLVNLETKTRNQVSQLSETRSMVKNISYDHAIKESDIKRIAPKDLITFEALPNYLDLIQSLAAKFTEVIESTQLQLMEISNICDFNLETALAALDDETQHDRAKSMSIEGIDRAHSRLQDIAEALSELAIVSVKTIHAGVSEFNNNIVALNEIDRAFETQIRVAKAMAVEKAKAFRARLLNQIRWIIPRLSTNLKRRGLMIYKRYRETTQKYGIVNPPMVLSAELSGFLSDTDITISNMPFVYQRLYEIAPLDNLYFYEPRLRATLALRKAFETWDGGHFGATALIAEAGGGTTTLIHFFLRELKTSIPTIQSNNLEQIYSKDEFFHFFEQLLDTDGITDTDALINYLCTLDGKRIIILEDLEHFFLRKVDGFECIKILIEIITRTNHKIFWLTTINQYSYQYLVKTVNIDEYFSYNIMLRPLRPAQMTSLVLKRHRVSGFNISFRPHKQDRKNNSFKKMNEEQQQEYLQKEFFMILNKIAQSNITLALIYWIRSIKEIQEDKMYLRSLKALDFSFLTKLSDEKLFTLHALLLHHGITIKDHSKVFQQTLKESKLTILLLVDDGIIVHNEGRYYINPLLYRQVVNLLTDKNMLH